MQTHLKKALASYFDITLNRRTTFFLIMVIMAVVVIDSTVVEISSYSGLEAPPSLNITLFIILFIVFAVVSAFPTKVSESYSGELFLQPNFQRIEIFKYYIDYNTNLNVHINLANHTSDNPC